MRVGLIAAAHHQLHAPVILVWDNLNTHISTVVRNRLKRIQYWPRPHSLVRTRRPRREAPKLA